MIKLSNELCPWRQAAALNISPHDILPEELTTLQAYQVQICAPGLEGKALLRCGQIDTFNVGFPKWGYPRIIHFNKFLHIKLSSYGGTQIYRNHHIPNFQSHDPAAHFAGHRWRGATGEAAQQPQLGKPRCWWRMFAGLSKVCLICCHGEMQLARRIPSDNVFRYMFGGMFFGGTLS